jgi:hypothetical protein
MVVHGDPPDGNDFGWRKWLKASDAITIPQVVRAEKRSRSHVGDGLEPPPQFNDLMRIVPIVIASAAKQSILRHAR